jgi:Patched family
VVEVMTRMGPAVLNGGLSTILAFILLSTSDTYIFLSFFKIFFLICLFGLYHGLIVLPVVLSLVGPLRYQAAEARSKREEGGLESERQELTQLHSLPAQAVRDREDNSEPQLMSSLLRQAVMDGEDVSKDERELQLDSLPTQAVMNCENVSKQASES